MAQCQITRSDISYPPTDIKLRTVANENGIKNTLVSVQPANTSQQHPSDHITSVHIINAGQVVQMRLAPAKCTRQNHFPLAANKINMSQKNLLPSSFHLKPSRSQRPASWKKE
jgi:hypothetical protein